MSKENTIYESKSTKVVLETDGRTVLKRHFIPGERERELKVLRSLPPHKGIVDFRGTIGTDALRLRYYPIGSLESYWKAHGPFHSEEVYLYTKQIFEALAYLHRYGFIHRDVHPKNFLVESPTRIVLSDFGYAVKTNPRGTYTSRGFTGTPFYSAPEAFSQVAHTIDGKSDVWSGAISSASLLRRDVIWLRNASEVITARELGRRIRGLDYTLSSNTSEHLESFYRVLLVTNPGLRPSAEGALEILSRG